MLTMRFWKVAFIAVLVLTASGPSVMAENGASAPSFWQRLFGGAPEVKAPVAAPQPTSIVALPHRPKKRVRDFVPVATTRTNAGGGAPIAANYFISVLGDSLAVQAADGLTQAFADKPEIAVSGRARDSSGLVRDDYYDWPKAAHELATGKERVDFLVVMLGINDMQSLRDGQDALDPLSDRWRAIYSARIESLVEPFASAHVPIAWVGLPPMKGERFNAQAVKLNELYKERAEKAGAKYIDIWDAFADQSGQYDAFGPDIDGQNAKLRGVDGIHFTKAGARKVAHFLEAEIKRGFDKARPQSEVASLPPDIEQAAVDINAQIRREMGVAAPAGAIAPVVAEKPLAGPILSLTARPVSAGGALASRRAGAEPVNRILTQGEAVAPRLGRADDFSWPRL